MGTWSKPLFVTACETDVDLSSYTIDIRTMPKEVLQRWQHNAFFSESKDIWTLPECMDTGCDTHKILDYMTAEASRRWSDLFDMVYTKYPDMPTIVFHFLCTDTNEPFYFVKSRTDKNLWMWIGQSESLLYQKHTPRGDRPFTFQETKYRAVWRKASFRPLRLQ
jgi:hypothetical protein